MISTTLRLLTLFAAVVALAHAAVAGPLPTDPNAFLAGSSNFTGTTSGFHLNSTVEYAVYAPGQFGTSVALGLPAAADPSAGTDWVYAYEVFNNAAGTANMTSLSVGLLPGAIPDNSTRIGNDATTPALGTAPNLSQFIPAAPPSSAKWSYTTTSLTPGNHSDILFFTSPFGPTTILASMVGGHATLASNALPTPVPEPATFALASIALTGLLVVGARRQRVA